MDSGTTRSESRTRQEAHSGAEAHDRSEDVADAHVDDDVLDAEVVEVGTEPGRGPQTDDEARSAGVRTDTGVRADIGDDSAPDESSDDDGAAEAATGAEAPPVHAEESAAVDDPATVGETEKPVEHRPGRGGFDPQADAIASAARYRTRQRVVMSMAGGFLLTAVLALLFTSLFWWLTGIFGAGLGLYLVYLRRQVHIEQEIRRRRLARLQRSRRDAAAQRRTRDTVPGPPRRQGVIVLEADDEDPAFEHLPPYAQAPRENLRHASGQ